MFFIHIIDFRLAGDITFGAFCIYDKKENLKNSNGLKNY